MGEDRRSRRYGLAAAAGAFVAWGLVPIYWKSLHTVPVLELVCHRLVWSVLFLTLVIALQGGWRQLLLSATSARAWGLSVLSGAIIGGNWFLYIWGVNAGHIVEASLGYYMNPLVNVALGYAFFSERLRRLQKAAILLAVIGVLNLTFGYGRFPWMGLALAVSFALYGALRKVARLDAIPGQWMETLVLGLPASCYLLWLQWSGGGAFAAGQTSLRLLLAASGVVTSLPLVGFAYGVRRLSLATVGVLQYIAPTIAFLLGVFLYREPFTRSHLVTFCCIWLGILAYTLEGVFAARRLPPPPAM